MACEGGLGIPAVHHCRAARWVLGQAQSSEYTSTLPVATGRAPSQPPFLPLGRLWGWVTCEGGGSVYLRYTIAGLGFFSLHFSTFDFTRQYNA